MSPATTHDSSSALPMPGSGLAKRCSTMTLRESLNEHLEQAAHRVAPEFAAFLTRHISDTVKSWDARDMSRQIELNIGKDLQFIRINGTLVGGTIGLLLWLFSQIPTLLHLKLVENGSITTLPAITTR
jgi:hypothetical protein